MSVASAYYRRLEAQQRVLDKHAASSAQNGTGLSDEGAEIPPSSHTEESATHRATDQRDKPGETGTSSGVEAVSTDALNVSTSGSTPDAGTPPPNPFTVKP